jgi:hypothetical protein
VTKYAVRVKQTGAYVSWPKNGRGDIKTVKSLDKATLFKSEDRAVQSIDDSPLLLKRGGSILSPDEEEAAWAECEDLTQEEMVAKGYHAFFATDEYLEVVTVDVELTAR